MPWTREEIIFCASTFFNTKSFKTVQAKFRRKLNNYSQKKTNLSLDTQSSSHRVSKKPQQKGRKSQIWQEGDCKTL